MDYPDSVVPEGIICEPADVNRGQNALTHEQQMVAFSEQQRLVFSEQQGAAFSEHQRTDDSRCSEQQETVFSDNQQCKFNDSNSTEAKDEDKGSRTWSDENDDDDEPRNKKRKKKNRIVDSDDDNQNEQFSETSSSESETEEQDKDPPKKKRRIVRSDRSDSEGKQSSDGRQSSASSNTEQSSSESDIEEKQRLTKKERERQRRRLKESMRVWKIKPANYKKLNIKRTKRKRPEKKKKPVRRKSEEGGDRFTKNLAFLKRCIKTAGIPVFFGTVYGNATNIQEKIDILLDLLKKYGVTGIPTIKQCKDVRLRLEMAKDVQELNTDLIINAKDEEEGTPSTRRTRRQNPLPPSPKPKQDEFFTEIFTGLKGIVSDESSDEQT